MSKPAANKKALIDRFPNAILLLFGIIVLFGALSYVIPAGEFGKIVVNGKPAIDPESFHIIPSTPTSFLGFFTAVPLGLQNAAALIFMIFLIGGAINIFEKTGAIEGAIGSFAKAFGNERSSWVLVLITTFFACLGAFPGMLEAAIPFAPLCIGIALSLGYDLIVGISIAVIGIIIGWTAGPTNPWTVGIGQNMAQLPLFSGIGYRLLVFAALLVVSNIYIVRYASKIKKDPTKSLVYGMDTDIKASNLADSTFTGKQKIILLVFALTIGTIIYGTLKWSWGITQMSALYIIGGSIAGIIAGFNANKIVEVFVDGGKAIFGGALAVGVARGISVVMTDAKIIDTIIHYLSLPLKGIAPSFTGVLMFVVQTIINFFIPSGSGQAMATLPIMLPLSDIIHLNKQIAILAFQFGDGLSNLCYPTVAVLIAYLTYTKVSFPRWLKYIMPFMVITWIISAIMLIAAVGFNYS